MLTVKYANALRDDPASSYIKINTVTPANVATDMNAFKDVRSTDKECGPGLLGDVGETPCSGTFFDQNGSPSW